MLFWKLTKLYLPEDSFHSDLFKYSYRQKDCFDYCIGREIYKRINITNKIDH